MTTASTICTAAPPRGDPWAGANPTTGVWCNRRLGVRESDAPRFEAHRRWTTPTLYASMEAHATAPIVVMVSPGYPERDGPRVRPCSRTSRPSPRAGPLGATSARAPMARHPPTVTLLKSRQERQTSRRRTGIEARGADVTTHGREHEPRTSAAPPTDHRMTADGGACPVVEGACNTFRNSNGTS